MKKIKIKVFTLGKVYDHISLGRIAKSIFDFDGKIGNIEDKKFKLSLLKENKDKDIASMLHKKENGYDFYIYITSVPLENNFYMRSIAGSLVLTTFNLDLKEFFVSSKIAPENFILKCTYEAALMYLYNGRKAPDHRWAEDFVHEDVGCVFDFNQERKDVHHLMEAPFICPDCERKLSSKLDKKTLALFQEALRKMKKPWFYRIKDFLFMHPIWSFIIVTVAYSIVSKISDWTISSLVDYVRTFLAGIAFRF